MSLAGSSAEFPKVPLRLKVKFLIFDWGTLISAILALAALVAVTIWPPILSEAGVPGVGLLLGFIYFLQKQKLQETKLFKELFVAFNNEYGAMSEKLESAWRETDEDLSDEDKATLVQYLNLCSEEFLFYERGYIHPSAWKTWAKGMLSNLSKKRVCQFAKTELKENCYYGLEEVINLACNEP